MYRMIELPVYNIEFVQYLQYMKKKKKEKKSYRTQNKTFAFSCSCHAKQKNNIF